MTPEVKLDRFVINSIFLLLLMFLFSDPTRTRTGNQASAGEWAAAPGAANNCERRQKSRARARGRRGMRRE